VRAAVFSRSWLAGELFAPTLPRVDRRVAGARHIGASRAHDPVMPRPQPAAPSRASSAVAIATRRATQGSNAVQFMFDSFSGSRSAPCRSLVHLVIHQRIQDRSPLPRSRGARPVRVRRRGAAILLSGVTNPPRAVRCMGRRRSTAHDTTIGPARIHLARGPDHSRDRGRRLQLGAAGREPRRREGGQRQPTPVGGWAVATNGDCRARRSLLMRRRQRLPTTTSLVGSREVSPGRRHRGERWKAGRSHHK